MLGQGKLFGEIDLLFNRPYQFSLRVTENDSAIYTIENIKFESLINKNKDIFSAIIKHCKERNMILIGQIKDSFILRMQ
jgi:CRP-like cAMP-binding protein